VLARYRHQADALNVRLSEVVDGLDVRLRPRAQRLSERLRRELNSLVTARSSAEEALAVAAADFDVELPERPGPVLDDAADRWLFADERRWLDQLDTYWRWRTEPTNGDKADQ
jgi:hypothetical protein